MEASWSQAMKNVILSGPLQPVIEVENVEQVSSNFLV